MNTTEKGNLTELRIAVKLLEKGRIVLRSIGEGCRYDLLIDDAGTFTRIQCKTGWVRDGVMFFNATSNYRWKAERPRYDGQADYFGVYCSETDKCYMIPVAAIKAIRGSLRVAPVKNNQVKGIMFAKDFEI